MRFAQIIKGRLKTFQTGLFDGLTRMIYQVFAFRSTKVGKQGGIDVPFPNASFRAVHAAQEEVADGNLGQRLAAQGIVARDGNSVDQGLQVVVMMRHGFVHHLLRVRACIVAQMVGFVVD